LFVAREADQFINPLKAPVISAIAFQKHRGNKNCLEIEDGEVNDDIQMRKARQVLFCGGSVAGAN
jgi:carboxyl-terminal processing protease